LNPEVYTDLGSVAVSAATGTKNRIRLQLSH
jgi:hypothetical protein